MATSGTGSGTVTNKSSYLMNKENKPNNTAGGGSSLSTTNKASQNKVVFGTHHTPAHQ